MSLTFAFTSWHPNATSLTSQTGQGVCLFDDAQRKRFGMRHETAQHLDEATFVNLFRWKHGVSQAPSKPPGHN